MLHSLHQKLNQKMKPCLLKRRWIQNRRKNPRTNSRKIRRDFGIDLSHITKVDTSKNIGSFRHEYSYINCPFGDYYDRKF